MKCGKVSVEGTGKTTYTDMSSFAQESKDTTQENSRHTKKINNKSKTAIVTREHKKSEPFLN